ncbi:MAG: hypothetical protein KDH20_01255 [Rhodocyclaceae bacterium]|nr:hypothetical protein [Rhodocyclaceae bacterium]
MSKKNSASELRLSRLLSMAILTLGLSLGGCGGGGGGSDSADADSGTDTTAEASDNTDADSGTDTSAGGSGTGGTGDQPDSEGSALTAAELAGVYVSDCIENGEVSAPAGNVRQIVTLTLTQTADDQLAFSRREEFFDPADISCTGNSIGTYENGHSANSWHIDGQKNASFNSTIVSATTVTVTTGSDANISVGGSLVLNGLTFVGDYFSRSGETRDLAYIDTNGALHLGSGDAGSDGYPEALDDSAGMRRL